MAIMDGGNQHPSKNDELSLQINEMIEKREGVWSCKICGKFANRADYIRKHSETHIEGMSHACHICNKSFSNRPGLRHHIMMIHSELSSCDLCGKSGMNKMYYYNHKQRQHKTLSLS